MLAKCIFNCLSRFLWLSMHFETTLIFKERYAALSFKVGFLTAFLTRLVKFNFKENFIYGWMLTTYLNYTMQKYKILETRPCAYWRTTFFDEKKCIRMFSTLRWSTFDNVYVFTVPLHLCNNNFDTLFCRCFLCSLILMLILIKKVSAWTMFDQGLINARFLETAFSILLFVNLNSTV